MADDNPTILRPVAKQDGDDLVHLAKMSAKYYRAIYSALIAEGFDGEQAMKLMKLMVMGHLNYEE